MINFKRDLISSKNNHEHKIYCCDLSNKSAYNILHKLKNNIVLEHFASGYLCYFKKNDRLTTMKN